MLTYKAMYKFVDGGVHGEVLDFAGVFTCGKNLDDARRSLASALIDMAETNLSLGESLPMPGSTLSNAEADLEEPVHLVLSATNRVKIIPESVYEAT